MPVTLPKGRRFPTLPAMSAFFVARARLKAVWRAHRNEPTPWPSSSSRAVAIDHWARLGATRSTAPQQATVRWPRHPARPRSQGPQLKLPAEGERRHLPEHHGRAAKRPQRSTPRTSRQRPPATTPGAMAYLAGLDRWSARRGSVTRVRRPAASVAPPARAEAARAARR